MDAKQRNPASPKRKAMKFPRHQNIVDACKRIGKPRSLRAVRGWSRGESECRLSVLVPLADELGLDVEAFAREFVRRSEAWLERTSLRGRSG